MYEPHGIGVTDLVTYAEIEHVVRGAIVLSEGGMAWHEHLSTARPATAGSPFDDEGELEMTPSIRREIDRGHLTCTPEGTLANRTMDYVHYATTDDTSRIAFQRWTSTQAREASADRSVSRGKFTNYYAAAGT